MNMTQNSHSLSDLATMMRDRNISPTAQRLAVAYVLLRRKTHLSAEELYKQVNHQRDMAGKPHVSKATIYNTLGLFTEQGLIKEVLVDSARVFYDSNTEDHHHLFNVDNGQLEDIPKGDIQISGLPVLPDGTSLDRVDIIIRVKEHS